MLHALIKQRQRDVERGRDAIERMARLAHDLKVSNHQRDKLAQRFAAKERELGALENRVTLPRIPGSPPNWQEAEPNLALASGVQIWESP